ncbi:gag-polypeptide of LTR copia-type domain-containing protein [Phthorimaea operculella]|nr:gag-polypeptide of LTR copia-type domain-containing protein [Phthorimaea operculella]
MESTIKFEEITSVQKLSNAESYPMWKFQIDILLKSCGLYEFVQDGDVKRLSLGPSDDSKKDAQAQRIILQSIDKKNIPLIMTCDSAKLMYQKLCKTFEKSTDQQKCNLLQDFYKYNYNEKNDMTFHITHIQNLAHQINLLGEKINESMIISKILSTIPQKYNYFATAWESCPLHERTLDNLTTRLICEEQRKQEDPDTAPIAFKAELNRKLFCSFCKKNNHAEKDCFFKNKNKPFKICKICKKYNHEAKDCYFKTKHNNKHISFLSEAQKSKIKCTCEFAVDSGCTVHMTNKEDILSNTEICNIEVQTAEKDVKLQSVFFLGYVTNIFSTLKI